MVGTWATFASSLTEDDPLPLLPSPEFDDDDPSSYLLYPPGFGPVDSWLVAPPAGRNLAMLASEASMAADPDGAIRKGADLVPGGGREGAGSASLEDVMELEKPDCGLSSEGGRVSAGVALLGLSEALSGKVSLVGDSDRGGVPELLCASDCGGKDAVGEYMVLGNLDGDGEAGVCNPGDSGGVVPRASDASVSGSCGGCAVRPEAVSLKEDGNGVGEAPPVITEVHGEDYDGGEANSGGGGSSESESDDSSTTSSSNSEESSEEDDNNDDESDEDDDNGDDGDGSKGEKMDGVLDLEEGEIRDLEAVEEAMSSDDEENGRTKGPVRSKNELEALPPVPTVNATLQSHHRTSPLGVISSIIGTRVIVEGLEKHNPLNEGSILWITETRSPLGLVDEIFGPVKNPYYVVRFNSEKDIPSGISKGTVVSYVVEFAGHILNYPALYKKGYDASGENDEEVGDEEEFSDDEKEADYRRSLRQSKRGTDNRRQRNQESTEKKRVQFDKRRVQTRMTGFRKKDVQPLVPSADAPVCQPPNAPSQLQSKLGQPFIPGQVQTPIKPYFVSGQMQVSARPPCVPGQVQTPPQQQPSLPGQPAAVPQQPCVTGQLQAPQLSLQQPRAPSQPQASTLPPYVLGQPAPPFVPGLLQPPPLVSSVGCGDFTHSFVAGQPGGPFGPFAGNVNGPPTIPAISHGGQPGGPFGVIQQNLLMSQSNAVWANGVPPQQFIAGLPSTLPNNVLSCQQLQNHHPFDQHQNQNLLFPNFNNGMAFQNQFIPNQGMHPNVSWQGGLQSPSVGPRSSEPMGDSLREVKLGHIGGSGQGAFGLFNGEQNCGQFPSAMPLGGMHAPLKFNMGKGGSSVRGRKPYASGRS